jgi:hypothetical protein
MRVLQQLVEQRRALVDDVRRLTNRITDALKQYFPQALEWFHDKDTVVFCDFLTRWPTLKQAQRARQARLRGNRRCLCIQSTDLSAARQSPS